MTTPVESQTQVQVFNLEATRELAREIAREFLAFGAKGRLLLLLDGPMGAGKTELTRELLRALGSQETCSPSFAIHNSYRAGDETPVEHFDLFRLESADDLESTGFWDCFDSSRSLIIIEWASRLNEFGLQKQLPLTWPRISLTIDFVMGADAEARMIQISRSRLAT